MKRFILKQWFLLALLAVLILGFRWPETFRSWAESSWLRNGVVASVLFLMALPLETRVVRETLRRPWTALLGSLVNMGLMPLMAWALVPLIASELQTGWLIAAAVPCTLASAAVWTRRAGGNDAAAILVTVITNATCFLTTPAWLLLLTNTRTAVKTSDLIWQLAIQVVLPMACGQLVRISSRAAVWATARRAQCGLLAQMGILLMVLVGATQCGLRLASGGWSQTLSSSAIVGLVVAVSVLHLAGLIVGFALAQWLRFTPQDRIAVAISGSQKTLMVGIYIAVEYFGGLAILPMVAYHVSQLVIDTLLADWWVSGRRVKGSSDTNR